MAHGRGSLWSLMVLALAACGGGGSSGGAGGVSGPTAQPPVSRGDPAAFETAEYRRSEGAERINASSIYAAGGTGAGRRVAVIDTGIAEDHPEFAGAIAAASRNVARNNGDIADPQGHGTAVAGLLGARRDGAGIHGVAFDSELLVLRADAPGSCPDACSFSQGAIADATDAARAEAAHVVNYSLGGASSLSSDLRQALADAAGDRLLVFAAGNEGQSSPGQPALFAASAEAQGTGLIVGAVDADDAIASFSNRAGPARDVYLVAPGVGLETTGVDGGSVLASGTSMATPLVSGAAAILWQAAPHLTAAEVASLLLDTATDLGDPGVDPVYGRGLVNLAEAVAPQGTLTLPEGDHVAQGSQPLATSSLALGGAFGADSALADEFGPVMALDDFGRAYAVEGGDLVATRAAAPNLEGWLRPAASWRVERGLGALGSARVGLVRRDDRPAHLAEADSVELAAFALDLTPAGTVAADRGLRLRAFKGDALAELVPTGPGAAAMLAETAGARRHAGLVEGAGLALEHALGDGRLRLAFTAEDGIAGDGDAADRRLWQLEMARRFGPAEVSLGLGRLEEPEGLLGSTGSGLLAQGSAETTHVVSFGGGFEPAAATRLVARFDLGLSDANRAGDAALGHGSVVSSAWALGIEHAGLFAEDDGLSLMLAQPLRVESGSLEADLPVARTTDGAIVRETRRADLAPSGREIDLEVGYRRGLGARSAIAGNLLLRHHPGHDGGAAPEAVAAFTYRLRF